MGAEIGLKAVMDMVGFSQGINKYNEMVGGASDKTDKSASGITKAFATIGKVAAGLAVGGITMLTTAAIAGVKTFTDWAGKVGDVGDILGTTAEESSTLAVAAEIVGGNVEQLAGQMAKLSKGLFDANGELGPAGKLMTDLGISFQDANGNLLPTTEILQNVADKVGTMDDGLEKTEIMMGLFGTSGKEMGDLLGSLANGGMEEVRLKTQAMGLAMTDEGVASAEEMGRSMNELKLMAKGLFVHIGSELLPILKPLFEDFMKLAIQAVPYVKKAIEDAIPVIQDIFRWIGENLIPVIKDLVAWLIENVPPAVTAAINAFNNYLLPAIKGIWAFIKDELYPRFMDIYRWLSVTIPPIIEFFVTYVWPKIKEALNVAWTFITQTLMPALGDIVRWLQTTISNAIDTFKPIWEKIKTAFSEVVNWVNTNLLGENGAFTKIVSWLGTAGTKIGEFVSGAMTNLKRIFVEIKQPIDAVLGVLKDIVEWAIDAIAKVRELLGLQSQTNPGTGGPAGQGGPDSFAGGGSSPVGKGGGGMVISNNNTVNIYVNAAISNGMDLAAFDTHMLNLVKGAI